MIRPAPTAPRDPAADLATRKQPPRAASFKLAAALLALGGVLVSIVLVWPAHGWMLQWDEVDYSVAADLGIVANLLEQGSLSPQDYARFVRAKVSGDEVDLPAGYDERSDPLILRHYHPPLVPVVMRAFSPLEGERGTRAVQLLGCIALVAVVVVAYLQTSRRPTPFGLGVLLLGLVWGSAHLFRYLQFHGWEAVWVAVVALCLMRWLADPRPRPWGIALCAALAAAILTLQSGAFLLLPVALVAFVRARRGGSGALQAVRAGVLPGLAVVVAVIVVVWPGSVLKASLAKIPLLYAALITGGDEYAGDKSAVGSADILVPVLVVLTAIGYLFARRRGDLRRWGPWAAVGGTYTLALLPFSLDPRYALPGIIPMFVLVAYAIDDVPRPTRAVATVALAAMLVAGLASQLGAISRGERDNRLRLADLAFVRAAVPDGRPALIDGGHIYRYYLGNPSIEDLWPTYDQRSLLVRRDGEYLPVTDADLTGRYVSVLRARTGFEGSPGMERLSQQCPLTVRPTLWFWDCTSLGPPS